MSSSSSDSSSSMASSPAPLRLSPASRISFGLMSTARHHMRRTAYLLSASLKNTSPCNPSQQNCVISNPRAWSTCLSPQSPRSASQYQIDPTMAQMMTASSHTTTTMLRTNLREKLVSAARGV
eukprot:TRINITY_DN14242_c0_g1_i2.p2 TRINITY_DN14242_c0_g1~~TRINITY_DN14242_c0_g1_i2.p2  ORF type:complete len:123 (-),score=7.54 TRINITY_DN14242_c0_g1_i2:519-887(-)